MSYIVPNSLDTSSVDSNSWSQANRAYSNGQTDSLGQTPFAGQWVNFNGVNDMQGGYRQGKSYFYLGDNGNLYDRKQNYQNGVNDVLPDLSSIVDPYNDPRFDKAGYDPDSPGSKSRLQELMSPAGSSSWGSDFVGHAPGNLYWNMQDPELTADTNQNAQTQLAKGDSGLTEFMGKLPMALAAGLVGGGISGALSGGAGALGDAGAGLSWTSGYDIPGAMNNFFPGFSDVGYSGLPEFAGNLASDASVVDSVAPAASTPFQSADPFSFGGNVSNSFLDSLQSDIGNYLNVPSATPDLGGLMNYSGFSGPIDPANMVGNGMNTLGMTPPSMETDLDSALQQLASKPMPNPSPDIWSQLQDKFMKNPVSNTVRGLSSVYNTFNGNRQANQMEQTAQQAAQRADPFASQRPQYQQQLQDSYTNPLGLMTGSEYGPIGDFFNKQLQAKDAAMGRRSQDYTRSLASQSNFMNWLTQYRNGLMQPSGANINPGYAGQYLMQGQGNANTLRNNAAGSIPFALASIFGQGNSSEVKKPKEEQSFLDTLMGML